MATSLSPASVVGAVAVSVPVESDSPAPSADTAPAFQFCDVRNDDVALAQSVRSECVSVTAPVLPATEDTAPLAVKVPPASDSPVPSSETGPAVHCSDVRKPLVALAQSVR